MKLLKSVILITILSVISSRLIFAGTTFAHPGATDSNGGHYNNSTGNYHYHHGYPAHYHTNGVCPYDYDDRTGWNSGTPSYGEGSSRSRYWPDPNDLPPSEADDSLSPLEKWLTDTGNEINSTVLCWFMLALIVLAIILYIILHCIYLTILSKDATKTKQMIAIHNFPPMIKQYPSIPKWIFYDKDGLPHSIPPHKSLDVYISKAGCSYHDPLCHYSNMPQFRKVNITCLPNKYIPCKKCRPVEKKGICVFAGKVP